MFDTNEYVYKCLNACIDNFQQINVFGFVSIATLAETIKDELDKGLETLTISELLGVVDCAHIQEALDNNSSLKDKIGFNPAGLRNALSTLVEEEIESRTYLGKSLVVKIEPKWEVDDSPDTSHLTQSGFEEGLRAYENDEFYFINLIVDITFLENGEIVKDDEYICSYESNSDKEYLIEQLGQMKDEILDRHFELVIPKSVEDKFADDCEDVVESI